jgi:transcriptional regulator NrdR family protein
MLPLVCNKLHGKTEVFDIHKILQAVGKAVPTREEAEEVATDVVREIHCMARDEIDAAEIDGVVQQALVRRGLRL